MSIFSISHPLEWLSSTKGQVSHVLLTRSPLNPKVSFDLHV
jgi:hypothetical protein